MDSMFTFLLLNQLYIHSIKTSRATKKTKYPSGPWKDHMQADLYVHAQPLFDYNLYSTF